MKILSKIFKRKENIQSLEEYSKTFNGKYKIIEEDLFYIFSLFINEELDIYKKLEPIIIKNIDNIFEIYKKIPEDKINNFFLSYGYSFIKNYYYFYIFIFLKYMEEEKIINFLKDNYKFYLKQDYIFDLTLNWYKTLLNHFNINVNKYTFYNIMLKLLNIKKYKNFNMLFFNKNIENIEILNLEYYLTNIKLEIIENELILLNNIETLNLLLKKDLNKQLKEKLYIYYIDNLYYYYMYNNNLDFLIFNNNQKYLTIEELKILIQTFGKKIENKKKYLYMLNQHKEEENKKYLIKLKKEIENFNNKEETYSCNINKKLANAKKIQELKKLKNKYRSYNIKKIIYNNTDFYLILCLNLRKKDYFSYINPSIKEGLIKLFIETFFQLNQYKKLLEFIGQLKNKIKYKILVKFLLNNVLLTEEDLNNEDILESLSLYPKLKKELVNKNLLKYNEQNLTIEVIENILDNGIDIIYQIYKNDLIYYYTEENQQNLIEFYKTKYSKYIEESNDFSTLGNKKFDYEEKEIKNMKFYYV